MEFPYLGKNCALRECNQLDFLPVKCDSCSQVFCIRHYQYENHSCVKIGSNRDNQVPVCPLCSQPVPYPKGQLPDLSVSQHIDQYCRSNELIKKPAKPKTNIQPCSYKSCKQKDVIYLECDDCKMKFCIKHRHPVDHMCTNQAISRNERYNGNNQSSLGNNWQSFKGSCSSNMSSGIEIIKNKAHQLSKSGQAALNRIAATSSSGGGNGSANTGNSVAILQGNLSEQEALSIALAESRGQGGQAVSGSTTNGHCGSSLQEQEDLALARAIQESQVDARNSRVNGFRSATKDSCILS